MKRYTHIFLSVVSCRNRYVLNVNRQPNDE
jgi:hypothetical protein